MSKIAEMISRRELAARWACSIRKIDRLRQNGDLAWIDLTAKKGKKPVVRFLITQITDFEEKCRMEVKKLEITHG